MYRPIILYVYMHLNMRIKVSIYIQLELNVKHVHGWEDGPRGLYEAHKAIGGGPRGKRLVPTSGGILRK